jgi:hypothetical protein
MKSRKHRNVRRNSKTRKHGGNFFTNLFIKKSKPTSPYAGRNDFKRTLAPYRYKDPKTVEGRAELFGRLSPESKEKYLTLQTERPSDLNQNLYDRNVEFSEESRESSYDNEELGREAIYGRPSDIEGGKRKMRKTHRKYKGKKYRYSKKA